MFAYWVALGSVLKDLTAAGVRVDSIVEVRQQRSAFRAALPVLIDWFRKTDNPELKIEIAGVLATRWAQPSAAGPLIEGFRSVDDASVRWSIGSAIAEVATEAEFGTIVELVEDRGYGQARERLVIALGKMQEPRAVDVLMRLLSDPDVVGQAVIALGKRRARQARPRVEALLKHDEASIRRAAKTALRRMA
jgi:HEAT repeat protein